VTLFDFESDKFVLQTQHDFQGLDFVYYNHPIEHYDLASIDSRIFSFEQLRYYAEVFFFLNADIDLKLFKGIFTWMGNRDSGKIIRSYSKERIEQMIEEVYTYKKDPFCRRTRRVIFNPDKIISKDEKMAIAAQITTRGVTYMESDLMASVDKLSSALIVITQDSLAAEMMCSRRTVNRLMNHMIKEIIKIENEKTRREKKIITAVEWIDILSDSGDQVKMQELKNLSNVRDYSIIRDAIVRYEKGF
jgi:hypothetical protein